MLPDGKLDDCRLLVPVLLFISVFKFVAGRSLLPIGKKPAVLGYSVSSWGMGGIFFSFFNKVKI